MTIQKPKGTQDILPGETEKWQYLEEKARDICRRFHYREIRTPIFEHTELFRRGVGETTDIVEKEMYTFLDKSDRSLSLRPEGTAGVVRAYAENKLYSDPDIQKLFYIGPMFRYEQPQAGRFRQFHQFGVEAFGSTDPSLDAEIIAMGYLFYKEIGLRGVRVEINTVGTPASRMTYRERLKSHFAPMLDKLCKDCQSRFERNPMRILDCKKDQHLLDGAPSIFDDLDESSTDHFDKVKRHLQDFGIEFTVNPRLVRGLDYYTNTAFEYKVDGIGANDTISGGGRYNGLVAQVGGVDQPGVGFGVGLERVLLVLEAQGVAVPAAKPLDVYVIALGERAEREAAKWLYRLREAGLMADKDYQGRKMKTQLKSADRCGARYAAILGDEELDRGVVTVKTMSTGDQEEVPMDRLVEYILEKR